MIKSIGIILLLLKTTGIYAQHKNDVDSSNTLHFIYVVPTSVLGSLGLDMNHLWLEFGYGIKHNNSMYSFGFDVMVRSRPNNNIRLLGGVSQLHSNGYNTNFEYKRLLTKRFYFATQLYIQHTGTTRKETYFLDQYNPNAEGRYIVSRNEIGLIPKVGFLIATKGKFSCDVGFGLGVRYIASSSSGKKNLAANNQKEYLTNKTFDYGNKIAQRLALQLRVGYSF